MRTKLILSTVCGLILVLAGCGSKDEADASATAESPGMAKGPSLSGVAPKDAGGGSSKVGFPLK